MNEPATKVENTVCRYRGTVEGLNAAAQKPVSTAWPSCTAYPAGVCCQLLAMMIQRADKRAPHTTSHMDT
jgi:hypothetical protein